MKSKNFSKTHLPTGEKSKDLKATVTVDGVVYVRIFGAVQQFGATIATRSTTKHDLASVITLTPGSNETPIRGSMIASDYLASPLNGEMIEIRTYEHGKITITLPGAYGLTWITTPRGTFREQVLTFRPFPA